MEQNKKEVLARAPEIAAHPAADQQAAGSVEADLLGLLVESQESIGGDWRERRDAAVSRARAALDSRAQPVAAGELSEQQRDAIISAVVKKWPGAFKDVPHKALERLSFAVERAMHQQCADSRQAQLDTFRRALEIIAVGDSQAPAATAESALVDAGAWTKCAVSRPAGGAVDRDAVLEEVAKWYEETGWLLDEDVVSDVIRSFKSKPAATLAASAPAGGVTDAAAYLAAKGEVRSDEWMSGFNAAATLAASAAQAAPTDADHPLRIELHETRDELARTKAKLVLANTRTASAALPETVDIDSPEFMQLLNEFYEQSSCEEFNKAAYNAARQAVTTHIRAALASQVAAAVPVGWKAALDEVERATRKFPTWPTDPLHAVAVLGEEFGELTKATLQTVYEPHKVAEGELRTEAVQTAAMALRFLASLDDYQFVPSEQHKQVAAPTTEKG